MDIARGMAVVMSHLRRRLNLDTVTRDTDGASGRVLVDDLDEAVEVRSLGDGAYRVAIEGHRFNVVVARDADTDWGWVDGRTYRWPRGSRDNDSPLDPDDTPIAATTPATVSSVKVAAGQTVARGDTLVVLEAMKMEIPLRAPRDGRVTGVRCAEGDQVDPGVPLVELED
ncbi:MAG: hypothetical protein CL477_06775 [Acidobacteria bacterium]|jgi:biotin carboxyl carrier protein|nr:hypothetical protein [Acidobacteriota bacterium]HJN43222.1 biotin/lipoyl-containing protein [Vicinamibacterales bacterium]